MSPDSSTTSGLVELDSLEISVLINDEIDQISPSPNTKVGHAQSFAGVPLSKVNDPALRGGAKLEMPMSNICCGAHGLSLLITASKGGIKRSLLFDAGPEGDLFERNATRLRLPLDNVEMIALSHWHRDHSGGLLSAIKSIKDSKKGGENVVVALPPDRPELRGVMFSEPISLEPDPTLREISEAGADIDEMEKPKTIMGGTFLASGTIPRQTSYEEGIPGGVRYDSATKSWTPDEMIMEERFIMCKLKGKGLVIFTGCSHAGLINIAKNAQELDNSPIYSIVGGYHLADATPEKMEQSMEALKHLKPALLMPGHCTGWRFKHLLETSMPGQMAPIFGGTVYKL